MDVMQPNGRMQAEPKHAADPGTLGLMRSRCGMSRDT
jgi:hypothetical protein